MGVRRGLRFLVCAELRDEIPGTSRAVFLAGLDGEPLKDEFCRLGVQFSTGERAAGPLAFVCEWPALGISETRTEIDAQLILDAASQSIVLWP